MGRWTTPKRDENHAAIVKAYQDLHVSVADCYRAGDGVPDLFVAVPGVTHAVEIKRDDGVYKRTGERKPPKLRPSQVEFLATWSGRYRVVQTQEDVIAHVADMRAEARSLVR